MDKWGFLLLKKSILGINFLLYNMKTGRHRNSKSPPVLNHISILAFSLNTGI